MNSHLSILYPQSVWKCLKQKWLQMVAKCNSNQQPAAVHPWVGVDLASDRDRRRFPAVSAPELLESSRQISSLAADSVNSKDLWKNEHVLFRDPIGILSFQQKILITSTIKRIFQLNASVERWQTNECSINWARHSVRQVLVNRHRTIKVVCYTQEARTDHCQSRKHLSHRNEAIFLPCHFFVTTYNCFVVFVWARVDTDDHPNFAFAIEIILEEMCQPRVAIWNHLNTRTNITRAPFSSNTHL